ncbi:afadin- and alpha-actinin-binding protein isoform X2 [Hippocampus comes]|uniref:afadin- and alpha-actinin-binding protein isoform X2 n=1 Tax=Hippocampus comes TaxID=109280 RepID=UPI00094E05BF|nr:PREDICTED: afadin- and alpha-actinin-binding protein-like isoform X2 [Hippocampus comes]
MASMFAKTRAGKKQEFSGSSLRDLSPRSKITHSIPSWEFRDQADSLRSARLQLRVNQHEAELRRKEQQNNRMKERLTQLSDRNKEKGPSIEVLNFPTLGRGKNVKSIKSPQSPARREEAALHLMLERREAELREAMKLRHSLTTLLHAIRVDMEQTLTNSEDIVVGSPNEDKKLTQAEAALGDHVTGGVVQSWKCVQRRLVDLRGHTGDGTDHDKLLAQLQMELKQSQQIVKLQQQMLQDSLLSSLPSELTDSYFLEERERLQVQWAEFKQQRRTFERERQSFTEAAIRLSRERQDFENEKGSLLKQQYLRDTPLCSKRASSDKTDCTLSLEPAGISGCVPISPSSTKSSPLTVSGCHLGRVRVVTPSTPELYAALSLSYNHRAEEGAIHSERWCRGTDGMYPAAPLDQSF